MNKSFNQSIPVALCAKSVKWG